MIPIISSSYSEIVIPLLKEAKTNLDILLYEWGVYSYNGKSKIQQINLEIISLARRGVPVRVILHTGGSSDHLRGMNARAGSWLASKGVSVKYWGRGGILHSKMLLIDKTRAIIGSHNFSRRSMSSNIETSVMVEGAGEIRPFQEYFDLLWHQA